MAKQNAKYLAGVNGGYFWRVDTEGIWVDNVCRGKSRKEAETPASASNVNFGLHDGTIKIDGVVYGSNCNCSGYSRPAVLKLNGQQSGIEVLHRGEQVDDSVKNAIASGPNLVSYDSVTGKSYVDIPADDDNINRLVYEAFTAVGVFRFLYLTLYFSFNLMCNTIKSKYTGLYLDSPTSKATSLVMVTTDGSDSCLPGQVL